MWLLAPRSKIKHIWLFCPTPKLKCTSILKIRKPLANYYLFGDYYPFGETANYIRKTLVAVMFNEEQKTDLKCGGNAYCLNLHSKSKCLTIIAKHSKLWNIICKTDKNKVASSVIFWDLSINLKKVLIFKRKPISKYETLY